MTVHVDCAMRITVNRCALACGLWLMSLQPRPVSILTGALDPLCAEQMQMCVQLKEQAVQGDY